MTNLSKFKSSANLPNKRKALIPVISEVKRLVNENGSDKFRALVMTSPNLYDRNMLSSLGVSDKNIVNVENDLESFLAIKSSCDCDMTDAPMDLHDRLFVESGGEPFHWIGLDFCGPMGDKLHRGITYISGQGLLAENSMLSVTALCNREKSFTEDVSRFSSLLENFDLPNPQTNQDKRELALFAMLLMSKNCEMKNPDRIIRQKYRADQANGKSGSLMLTFSSTYNGNTNKKVTDIWQSE